MTASHSSSVRTGPSRPCHRVVFISETVTVAKEDPADSQPVDVGGAECGKPQESEVSV